ncbi:hypothetical protein [Archangium sp.]|uniref:hypothetical protein n=1 Tax=Archangium sp. TaxID=1872627 RepID=UPI00286B5EDE|nr:hypothetical protein [Archangium sp.]
MTSVRTTSRTWVTLLLLLLAVSGCGGQRSVKQRQAFGEKRTDEATLLLNQAEQSLRNLDADGAVPKLAKAKEVLGHPDVDLSPEAEMCRSQLAELQALVPKVREEKTRRERTAREEGEKQKLDAAVEKQRDDVVQAMGTVTEAVEALEGKDVDAARVKALNEAIQRTKERLKAGKALEEKSEDYAASARRTERRLEQAEARARLAQRVVDFVSGPLEASQEAQGLEKKARTEKELEERLSLYTDVRERYQRCGEEAEKLLAEVPELARAPIQVKGRPTLVKAVAASCKTRAGTLQRTVAKLEQAKVKRDKFLEKLEKAKAAREEKVAKAKAAREAAKAAFAEKLAKAKAAKAEKLEKAKAAKEKARAGK